MNTEKTSRLIKQAEKLYDGEKYQEAIDLLLDKPSKKDKQNPYYWFYLGWCFNNKSVDDNIKEITKYLTKGIKLYEENPDIFTELREGVKDSKRLLIECYVRIGSIAINDENKIKVEACYEYILNHRDDCSDFDSFFNAGAFLNRTFVLGFNDNNNIDTVLELLQKADDLFDTKVGLDRIKFDLIQNVAFSQKGILCIEEGDFNNAQIYVEKIMKTKNKIPDNGWYLCLSEIGWFLALCYENRLNLKLSKDIFSIASDYLCKCLKSDEKHFQDTANWRLGWLNFENEKVAWKYFSKISKSNKEYYDNVILYNALFHFKDSPKEAIDQLLSLNKSEVIPKVVVDLFLGAMYFEDKRDQNGAKILNSLSRGDFTGELISYLPKYDLYCCIYLKKEGALKHLKVWTQKYPDSELFKKYLEIAKCIEIPPLNDLILSSSDLILSIRIPIATKIRIDYDPDITEPIINYHFKTDKIPRPKVLDQRVIGTEIQIPDLLIRDIFREYHNIKWSDLTIELVSDSAIRVSAPDYKTKRFNYTELGMRDGSKGDLPDRLWEMLKEFAMNNGQIIPNSIKFINRSRVEKRTSDLRGLLRIIFGLSNSPILRYHKRKGYITQFIIRDCRGAVNPDTDNSTY